MSTFDPSAFERPLTEYEKELLIILMEEAAEVIQSASKLLRFEYGNTNPDNGIKNYRELGLEVGDFTHMIGRCQAAQLISIDDMIEGNQRKEVRLAKYLRSKPDAKNSD